MDNFLTKLYELYFEIKSKKDRAEFNRKTTEYTQDEIECDEKRMEDINSQIKSIENLIVLYLVKLTNFNNGI